jgi:predicted proteasome-type protease
MRVTRKQMLTLSPVGRGLEIYTPRDIYQTVQLIGERVLELFAQNQTIEPPY